MATILEAIHASHSHHHAKLDFISLALHGKKIGFGKLIGMIDEMIDSVKQEQKNDETKREHCRKEMDGAEDKQKELEHTISDVGTAVDDAKESIATIDDDIQALRQGIKDLDKAVAEATEERKVEHQDFDTLMANNAATKDVLMVAKNRLNKFYNPKLYIPPPKPELSKQDTIVANMGGTTDPTSLIQLLAQHRDAPNLETYSKKSDESTGVMAMIGLLVSDLDKQTAEAEATEKGSQEDYEKVMADSAEKRTEDSKSLEEKESAKADLEGQLQRHKDDKRSGQKELSATLQFIHSLHSECDWLLKYFSVRKEARASEIDALKKAKAILTGADFALAQTGTRRYLRHSH